MSEKTASAQESDGTILIFGMPRSGTTWVGKLFDSHPSVLYRHEPDSWRRLAGIPLVPLAPYAESIRMQVRGFESAMERMRALKICGKAPIFPKAYLSKAQYVSYKAGVRFSQLAAGVGLDFDVVSAPRRLIANARLAWKSIESVGRLGLILESLPGSKAILLVRHPCGYIASVLRGERQLRFEDNQGASEDYGILEQLMGTELARERDLSIDYLRSLTPEERLAWRWALFYDQAIRDTRDSDRCAVVRYEDICADPNALMRKNFAFAGLEWAPQTEEFIKQSTAKGDDAYYSVYKDPRLVAEKWREELARETSERIMAVVRHTLPGSLFERADLDGHA